MRLIDADKLKEEMMKAFDCEDATKHGNKDAEQQAHSYSTLMLYEISNVVEDCIDNAPTIIWCDKTSDGLPLMDLRQRPKGEWKEVTRGINSNTYECPFCGRLINCDKPRLRLYPFCHCGADMRGGRE